jgi:hypothetical protein
MWIVGAPLVFAIKLVVQKFNARGFLGKAALEAFALALGDGPALCIDDRTKRDDFGIGLKQLSNESFAVFWRVGKGNGGHVGLVARCVHIQMRAPGCNAAKSFFETR